MRILILITILLFITGCEESSSSNCNKQIKSLTDQRGSPEEVQKYDSGDYHSHSYWYWSKGFSRTFTWGDVVEGCEISDYSFTPIN